MQRESDYEQLFKAFNCGEQKIIGTSLSKGNDITSSKPLIHSAIERNHLCFLEFLLDHGADVNELYDGKSLLEVAIDNKLLDIVKCILNHDVDVNVSTRIFINTVPYDDCTLLHKAVDVGDIEIIKLLLEKGINEKDLGRTKIKNCELSRNHNSIQSRDHDCYGLIENQLYVYRRTLTVLELAIFLNDYYYRNGEIIELLLKNGAVLDSESDQVYPLHFAIILDTDLFVIKKLIEYGANINSVCDVKKYTPLAHSMLTDNVNPANKRNTILYLLKKGAIFNLNSINSVLCAFTSKYLWREEDLELLINSGADINSKNESSKTPLHLAVDVASILCYKDQLKLLVDYGSDINVQDENGNTPLHVAIKRENDKGVEILLEYEVDLNSLNSEGHTPLMILNGRRDFSPTRYDDHFKRIESIIKSDYYVSYFYDKRFSHFEKITCMMIRAIVIKEESGKYVNDLSFIKIKIPFFYRSLKEELEKMKLKRVRVNVSYYDILTKSVNVLVNWVYKKIIEDIESSEIEKEFPFYGGMLRMRIRMIRERKILLQFCEKRFKTLFRLENETPILVINKIISYLSSIDLITLWRVFKRPEEYLSIFLNRPEGMDRLLSVRQVHYLKFKRM